jgi:hypothetical protein
LADCVSSELVSKIAIASRVVMAQNSNLSPGREIFVEASKAQFMNKALSEKWEFNNPFG